MFVRALSYPADEGEGLEGEEEDYGSELSDGCDVGDNELVRSSHPGEGDTGSIEAAIADTEVARRLDGYSNSDVEAELGKHMLELNEDLTVLDFLRDPGPGMSRAVAVKSVLDQLGDSIENSGFIAALVWRYAQIHRMWEDHPNALMRSPSALIKNLENSNVVRIGITIGTSTDQARRASINAIKSKWGPHWWQSIPPRIRPSDEPSRWPKRLLILIARAARGGAAVDECARSWETAVADRLDPVKRQRGHQRASTVPRLLCYDVNRTYRQPNPDEMGRRAVEAAMPELHEDRLELRGLQPTQTEPPEMTTRKRKRVRSRQVGGDEEGDVGGGERGGGGDGPPAADDVLSEECHFDALAAGLHRALKRWLAQCDGEQWCGRCRDARSKVARIRGHLEQAATLCDLPHLVDGLDDEPEDES